MPASVTSISARRQGTYVLLEAYLPGLPARNIGVYLVDPGADRLWLRMRHSYDGLAEPDDIEVLEALEEDIRSHAAEVGAEAFLQSLEDSLSNVVRAGRRQSVEVDAFSRVLDRLFDQHVEKIAVLPFRTPKKIGCAPRKACISIPAFSWRTWWAAPWSRASPMAA